MVASNTNFAAKDAALTGLQRLAKEGVIRRYLVLERGGMRFGIFNQSLQPTCSSDAWSCGEDGNAG